MKLVAFLLVIIIGMIVADHRFNIYEILQSIPANRRIDFVKHHIKKGKELTGPRILVKENKQFEEFPERFSVFLYNYVVKNHAIKDNEILKQLREVICFDDGTCFDIGNIGSHP